MCGWKITINKNRTCRWNHVEMNHVDKNHVVNARKKYKCNFRGLKFWIDNEICALHVGWYPKWLCQSKVYVYKV